MDERKERQFVEFYSKRDGGPSVNLQWWIMLYSAKCSDHISLMRHDLRHYQSCERN